jgi:cytochrome c oxidase subunit 2
MLTPSVPGTTLARRGRGAAIVHPATALTAAHSALRPAGPQAAAIASLWWIFLAVSAVVYVIVLATTARALWHRRSATPVADTDDRALAVVAGAVVATVLVVGALIGTSFAVGRRLGMLSRDSAVTIAITGHQWWWDIRYEGAEPTELLRTANEIHVPVGEPVLVHGTSQDVIHSFWVPSLHGKMDLIPGHDASIWIQADRPGVHRGLCAEFCGLQHAHMAIVLVAEPRRRFDRWLAAQRRPAVEPPDDPARAGHDVFMHGGCPLCHAVRGTRADATAGPDLTHLMSRKTLGAGTLPNRPGHLAGWIIDPHGPKPGVRMPRNVLPPSDVQALLAYLESLA